MFKKHHTSSLYKKFLLPLTGLSLFISVIFVYSLGVWNEGYGVDNGLTGKVLGGNNGSTCKLVRNNCNIGGGIFVPTRTNGEWQDTGGFIDKKPSCVNISSCTCSSNSDCGLLEICGPSANTIAPTFYSVTNACVAYSRNGAYGGGGAKVYNPGYLYNAINVPPALAAVLNSSYWANTSSTTTAGAVNKYAVWLDANCDGTADALTAGQEVTISYPYNNTGTQRTIYVGVAGDNYFRVKFNGVKIVEVTDSSPTTHTQFAYLHLLPITLKQGYNSFEALGRGDGSVNDAMSFVLYDNTLAQLSAATSDANLNILFSSASLAGNGSRLTAATCPEGYYLDTSAGVSNYLCRSNIGQCITTAKCGSSNGGGFTSAPTTNLCSVGNPSSVGGSGPWSWTCYDIYAGGKNVSCNACVSNNWTVRSSCSKSCGGGIQTRSNQCGTVQTQSCNPQNCCDYKPAGIYSAAEYWTSPNDDGYGNGPPRNCGSSKPACNTMNMPSNIVWGSYAVAPSAWCSIFTSYQYAVCGSLYKAGTICDGNPCVTSITQTSYGDRLTPSANVGIYDYATKTCKSVVSVQHRVNDNAWPNGGFANWGTYEGSSSYINNGAVAAW